ncbi:MAG: gamma-glutamylcyclotransferase [Candidatus Aenigmatarchaeota archaeon]
MDLPDDPTLPFFSYGLFKPGQLGYYRIEDYVDEAVKADIEGKLYERDGTPILVEKNRGTVQGNLLKLNQGDGEQLYESVAEVEPEKQYRWVERTVSIGDSSQNANVLLGRNPTRGSTDLPGQKWDGSTDPLFTDALDVVEEVIEEDTEFDWEDKKSFFRLHQAYLLLWSSIERYISLRYGLRGRFGDQSIRDKRNKMAEEEGFREGLETVYSTDRPRERVVRAGRPQDDAKLDPEDPVASLDYYYQVRSNLSHRGKSAPIDFDILRHSLEELYTIFRSYVLPAALENYSQEQPPA